MRSKAVRTIALALVLGGVGLTAAQQVLPGPSGGKAPPSDAAKKGDVPRVVQQRSPAERSRLEDMLADALKNNPDIRVASARMAEAEAEVNRVRMQVLQRVLVLTQEIDAMRKSVEDSEQLVAELQKQYEAGNAPFASVAQARSQLVTAKAKLAADEAELPYLLGKSPPGATAGMYGRISGSGSAIFPEEQVLRGELATTEARLELAKVQGSQAERIRKGLQTSIKVDYKDATFDDILKDLSKKVEGLSFRNLFDRGAGTKKINLQFEEALPVSAMLQALADETGCHFFVREYGIVAVSGNNQPRGAISVQEFLRQ
jgi:hypothetical protein